MRAFLSFDGDHSARVRFGIAILTSVFLACSPSSGPIDGGSKDSGLNDGGLGDSGVVDGGDHCKVCGDGGVCSSCGQPQPYCFNLKADSRACGSCTNDCQMGATAPDRVCQDGTCVKAACSVVGACATDGGVCCGNECCDSSRFCCNTSTGLRCIQATGETQCPW